MVFALFSCIAARQVELHQQHSTSPISTLWLVPQYFLLGLMEGFSGGGLDAFFYARVPKSMKSFAEPFSELVLCVGKFSNILFLLIFSPWFGYHSFDSHMDRYFLMLAIVCSVFFCFYLVSSLGYDNLETSSEMEESVAMEAGIETPEGDQRLRHDDQEEDEAEPEIEIIDYNDDTS
ncbi:hypothetical protein L6164_002227 [Bauhinia variegata]|uniref:Uncharacterized protein n=1 Tax=Bauhinia variegata TaxID=167791 RepID=A0ACB9PWS2_BAUVA|nr:hypothetical protein L6164_002227 [Bauhinia variegata]